MPKLWRIYCTTEGANVYVESELPPTICPNNAAHTVVATSVSIYDHQIIGSTLYGDGADGDVTIAVDTTLARDMYYRRLTLTTGATINVNGFRIFISDSLIMVSGNITANGGNAVGQTGGVLVSLSNTVGTGTAGGLGGTNLAAGSNGGTMTSSTRLGGFGSVGGAGFLTGGGLGGAGAIIPETAGGTRIFGFAQYAIRGRDITNVKANGGTGGGGGGGTLGANGGGGGAGGGIVMVAARNIEYTSGLISANGGDGGIPTGTAAGGGGGGGGGSVIFVSTQDSSAITMTVNGGIGGLSGGIGGNGVNGLVGNIFRVVL